MPENIDTQVRSLELSGNVPPEDPVELEVPREGELEVRNVSGRVFMRLNNRDQERRPLRRGETICWPGDGRVRRLLFDNGDGDGGSVEYEVRVGYTVRGFGGSEGKSQRPQATRLSAQLGEETTIADGAEACEIIEAQEVLDRLRIRARVSGTSSLEVLDDFEPTELANGARAIDVDQDNAHVFIGDDDGDLLVVDGSDPRNLTLLGEVTSASLSILLELRYDPVDDLVVAVGDDGVDTIAAVFDVSTRSAPTLEGTVVIEAGATGFASRVAILEGESAAYMTTDSNELAVVDYSTPAAPANPRTLDSIGYGGVAVDQVRDLMFVAARVNSGVDEVVVSFSLADPLVPSQLHRSGLLEAADGSTWDFGTDVDVFHDDGDEVLVLHSPSGVNTIATLATSDPQAIEQKGATDPNVAQSVTIDPERDLIHSFGGGGFNTRTGTWSYAGANVSSLPKLNSFQSTAGDTQFGAAHFESGGLFAVAPTEPHVLSIGVQAGSDILRVRPLRADGTPTPVGGFEETLRDEVETLIDIDPVFGEGRYEVCILGRSGTQTTVDFVEWSGR